jgi:hypothetical protein
MEKENKMEDKKCCPEECNCPCCRIHGMMHGKMCCGGKSGHRFMILRVILLLAILACIFSFGVKLGEFKSNLYGPYFREYTSHHEMMKYLNYDAMPTCGGRTTPSTTTP